MSSFRCLMILSTILSCRVAWVVLVLSLDVNPSAREHSRGLVVIVCFSQLTADKNLMPWVQIQIQPSRGTCMIHVELGTWLVAAN